jgi:integrase
MSSASAAYRALCSLAVLAEAELVQSLGGRSFARLLMRAGLSAETRFHYLRHTCATLLLSRNVNPKIVSEMLGHANIAITLDTYSHVLPDM